MKIISLFLLALCIGFSASAQKGKAKPKPKGKTTAKKPVKKGKTSSKMKTSGEDEFDFFQCYEGGGPCTFTLVKGDTLVYAVNKAGKSYDLFIVTNKFTNNALVDYSWYTSATDNRKGKVQINANGLMKSAKYLLDVAAGDTKLTDGSTFWLSEKGYKEIAAQRSTKFSLDNGSEETFNSPEADESNHTIKYKEKEMLLEGFMIENKALGQAGRKELSFLNISTNLLLLKADTDTGSVLLKEVRKSSAR
jgi:hypothetical protein